MELSYEVITPQTNAKYKIQALSYGDELDLKSVVVASESGITKQFNKVLYKTLLEKPDAIKSEDDFLNNTTIMDRLALVAGLYHISYGNEYISKTQCPQCGKLNQNKILLDKHSKMVPYDKGKTPFDFLNLKEIFSVQGIDGTPLNLVFKAPTLRKETLLSDTIEGMEIDPSIINILLYLDKITSDKGELLLDKNIMEIITIIKNQPAMVIRNMKQKLVDVFDKYYFKTEIKIKCKHCGNMYTEELDFIEQFFRNVIQA